MVLRFTPSLRNQAGSRLSIKYSGKPEVKPVNTQISIRRVNSAAHQEGGLKVIAGQKRVDVV